MAGRRGPADQQRQGPEQDRGAQQPAEKGGARGSAKPEAILKWAYTPIAMLGGLWEELREEWEQDSTDLRPPVFIIVCKNTRIAKVIYEWIAEDKPLDTASWRIQPPPSVGRRDGVVVTFPKPLDHSLLMRALGVTREGVSVEGDIVVDNAETRWTFTPREPWREGAYHLLALDVLEDVAGNQIGRAFEVDNFDTVDRGPTPKSITIPFRAGTARAN